MQEIWRYEDYLMFLDNDNPIVKKWACERLMDLFGEKAAKSLAPKAWDTVLGRKVRRFLDQQEEKKKTIAEYPEINPEQAGIKKTLKYLFKDKESLKGEERVISYLVNSSNRNEIITLSLAEINKRRRSWNTDRAVKLLGRLRAGESIPQIISLLNEGSSDYLCEAIEKALIDIGDMVLPHIQKVFTAEDQDPSRIIYIMGVLRGIPCRQAVNIILENFNYLWEEC